jgi:hypothetical protein
LEHASVFVTTVVTPSRLAGKRGRFLVPLITAVLAGLLSGPVCSVRGADQTGVPAERGDYYGDPLPAGAVARLGTLRYRFGAGVTFVSDRYELVASSARAVQFWDAKDGTLIREIPDDGGSVQAFSLSAVGSSLATLTRQVVVESREYESRLRLWDAETGELQATIGWTDPQGGEQSCLAFSPDGKVGVASSGQGSLRFFDVTSQLELLNY